MHVYFGTVVRGANLEESGSLIRLDWERKEEVAAFQVTPDRRWTLDDNPRGGPRGCRGIVATPNRVFAAGAHTIHELDHDLSLMEDHSHGLMVGLHELAAAPGQRIWAASTRINAAVEYDLATREVVGHYLPRQMPPFQALFDLKPLGVDPAEDQRGRWRGHDLKSDPGHLHLNAVAVTGDRVLALFNRFGAIVDLSEGREIVRDPSLERGHNIGLLDDGTLVSVDTHGPTVRFYDPDDGRLVHMIDLLGFSFVKELRRTVRQSEYRTLAKPLFTRGLAVAGDRLIVGTSPATLLMIDWRTGELVDTYQHSDDVRVAVHGLTLAAEIA